MRKRKDKQKTIKIPPEKDLRMPISIPKVKYAVVKQSVLQTAFTGNVTVIPTVLVFYLRPSELRVVTTIIQETMENGVCELTAPQFCIRLKMSHPTFVKAMYNLTKMHVVYQERHGWKWVRAVDFNSVQHLNDVLAAEDRGVYTRLRTRCKNKNINNIGQDDLNRIYDQHVLSPDHDIEEEEEYD